MSNKKHLLFVMLPVLLVLLSACSLSFNSASDPSKTPDLGGVFLSVDGGNTFKSQSYTPTISGTPGNIAGVNVRAITIDPSDNAALYLATYNQGLYYTYNILSGWLEVKGLPKTTISFVAVNPKNKCDIYASYANRLMRSVDCNRTWTQIYIDANAQTFFTTLAIDFYNPKNIYLGTTNGDILKSIDEGYSWRVLKRLEEPISNITLSPDDSRHVYVVTRSAKIYSFFTNTRTNPDNSEDIEGNFAVSDWTDSNRVLSDLQFGSNFRGLVAMPDNELFLASDSNIARSPDGGITWQKLALLPDERDAIIRTIAVNPQNNKEIYYATGLTFFKSTDGGVTWSSKKLPTSRWAADIQIDYKNPSVIYLGAYKQ